MITSKNKGLQRLEKHFTAVYLKIKRSLQKDAILVGCCRKATAPVQGLFLCIIYIYIIYIYIYIFQNIYICS